jgi:hypothetical protein
MLHNRENNQLDATMGKFIKIPKLALHVSGITAVFARVICALFFLFWLLKNWGE